MDRHIELIFKEHDIHLEMRNSFLVLAFNIGLLARVFRLLTFQAASQPLHSLFGQKFANLICDFTLFYKSGFYCLLRLDANHCKYIALCFRYRTGPDLYRSSRKNWQE